ncbi:MAG TPA: sialate O-acetylesterase [Armatimonadetes bacterium]|jgi:sialate O-acetylesterase|nr:sialate O-acetylesterase [Armatimonadota bacterium]
MHRSSTIAALAVVIAAMAMVCLTPPAAADVTLPKVISDNMVVQRDVRARIWGWADPGEEVTVAIRGQAKTRAADARGSWRILLDPMPAGGPFEMTVTGKNRIVVSNVAVGEVWVCSGQSNMAMRVASCLNFEQEKAAADYPMIRSLNGAIVSAAWPENDLGSGAWQVSTADTVGGFSAAGYFFARHLHQQLGVPIGFINVSLGGSAARAWVPAQDLRSDPDFAAWVNDIEAQVAEWNAGGAEYMKAYTAWQKEYNAAKAAGSTDLPKAPAFVRGRPQGLATGLYNGMIAPLRPMKIAGAIWYQGEADAGAPELYQKLFPMLINSWRREFRFDDMPFLFVQLADYDVASPWAFLREAQTKTLSLPNTGMAVITDVGDAKDIHPKDKQTVGYRLALNALAKVYGQDVVYSGPMYRDMRIEGSTIRISFDHVHGGLVARDAEAPIGFTIAGEDKQFVEAKAVIDGDTVLVSADGVSNPVAVRYAWASDPECNLYNAEGLPANPFRTDDWPRQ